MDTLLMQANFSTWAAFKIYLLCMYVYFLTTEQDDEDSAIEDR